MPYRCPVCAEPQADAEHLANHLAFSALLGRADHESWLDERVPDWGDRDPATLAPAVVEHAESLASADAPDDPSADHDHPSADHDHPSPGHDLATDHDHDLAPDHAAGRGRPSHGAPGADGDLDAETAAVLSAARDLTRRMRGEGDQDEAETE